MRAFATFFPNSFVALSDKRNTRKKNELQKIRLRKTSQTKRERKKAHIKFLYRMKIHRLPLFACLFFSTLFSSTLKINRKKIVNNDVDARRKDSSSLLSVCPLFFSSTIDSLLPQKKKEKSFL